MSLGLVPKEELNNNTTQHQVSSNLLENSKKTSLGQRYPHVLCNELKNTKECLKTQRNLELKGKTKSFW